MVQNQFVHNQFVHNQAAHNQFVARNFHGLYNFNHTGFNRNAFGDPSRWNRWGGRFWGAGWNRWGHGWGGWAGPVFWPFLYGDIFSFAFWPYDYYDPFWAYGPDFLLASIFAPGPYFGADYGYAPDYTAGYSGSPNVYYGGFLGLFRRNVGRSPSACRNQRRSIGKLRRLGAGHHRPSDRADQGDGPAERRPAIRA